MAANFAPRDLTSNTSHPPFIVTASSEYSSSFAACKAFNDNVDYWVGTQGSGSWIELEVGFEDSYILESYEIQVNSIPEPNRAPKDWVVLGSNDHRSWDTLDTVVNQVSWSSGEKKSFTCDVATTAYRYFRVSISANNGDTYVQIRELFLIGTLVDATIEEVTPHDLTSNTSHSPFVISESSAYLGITKGYCAFDSNINFGANHYWIGTGSGVDWIKIDIGESHKINRYAIRSNTIPEPNRMPKDWTFKGSNDDSSWTTLDTVTGETSWTPGEIREFEADDSNAYRYFKLDITANNGDPNYIIIAEMYLIFSTIEDVSGSVAASMQSMQVSISGTTTTESSYADVVLSSMGSYGVGRVVVDGEVYVDPLPPPVTVSRYIRFDRMPMSSILDRGTLYPREVEYAALTIDANIEDHEELNASGAPLCCGFGVPEIASGQIWITPVSVVDEDVVSVGNYVY